MQLHRLPCAQVLQRSGKVSAEELAPKAAQRPGWIGLRCANKPTAFILHKPAIWYGPVEQATNALAFEMTCMNVGKSHLPVASVIAV